MLDRLSRGLASVSELAAPLEMSLTAVVQHVQVLEASGLIDTEKVGRVRTCRVAARRCMARRCGSVSVERRGRGPWIGSVRCSPSRTTPRAAGHS